MVVGGGACSVGCMVSRVRRLSVGERLAAVAQAEVEGSAVVAARLGVSAATVRGWKHQQGKRKVGGEPSGVGVAPGPLVPLVPSEGGAVGTVGTVLPQDPLEAMAVQAGDARRMAGEATRQAANALTLGESVKVRELAAAAKLWGQTAKQLEDDIHASQQAQPKITEAILDELERRLRGCLAQLGHDPDRDPQCVIAIKAWFTGPTPDQQQSATNPAHPPT